MFEIRRSLSAIDSRGISLALYRLTFCSPELQGALHRARIRVGMRKYSSRRGSFSIVELQSHRRSIIQCDEIFRAGGARRPKLQERYEVGHANSFLHGNNTRTGQFICFLFPTRRVLRATPESFARNPSAIYRAIGRWDRARWNSGSVPVKWSNRFLFQ